LEIEKKCFLCGKNGYSDPLDSHHIFNSAYRKKSEKYGLKVWLCHNECHIFGRESVHRDQRIDNILKQHGQLKVMQEQGWTTEQFIKQFGKNYLEDL